MPGSPAGGGRQVLPDRRGRGGEGPRRGRPGPSLQIRHRPEAQYRLPRHRGRLSGKQGAASPALGYALRNASTM